MSRRTSSWIAVAVIAVGVFLFGAVDDGEPRTNADRAYAISTTVGCPVCSGQSAAESTASIAKAIRGQIASWVDEGRSDDFIRAELRRQYGEDIDYTPSGDGFVSLVWILPVVAGTAAGVGLFLVFRRWGSEAGLEASKEDERLVEGARSARTDD